VLTISERCYWIWAASYAAKWLVLTHRGDVAFPPDHHKLLQRHEGLFEGKLGTWDDELVHFDIKPNAKPFRANPYPVPRIHRDTIKRELKRLCELGVIEEIEGSQWAAPSFFIPKPDGTGRFLTDFRGLNSQIERKPYPLPKISDILQQMEGFSYATALDLNMGYYHLLLDAETSNICAIVFPWGFYRYKRLPTPNGDGGQPRHLSSQDEYALQ